MSKASDRYTMNRICLVFDLLEKGEFPELPEMFFKHTHENKHPIPNTERIGMDVNWDTNTLCLYLSHPFFPEFSGVHERIRHIEARRKYRFLFADTNPLLYKKFSIPKPTPDIVWPRNFNA